MKVASLALVLIASTRASLFEDEEDFGLQEEWEDFEDDRFLQQLMDENAELAESDPNIDEVGMDNEQVEGTGGFDRAEQFGRRQGKGSRGGGRRGGRRGLKNRKQRKGKGTFDIQKFLDKLEAKEAKMESKLDDKCERKLAWGEKICAQLPDKADCQQWALAQEVKCQAYGSCRIDNVQDKGKCMGEFKHMMLSFMKDTVDPRPNVTNDEIGQCFTDVLIEAKTCSDAAAAQYQTAMQGVTDLTEQEIATAKEALKEQRKLKRQQRKAQKMQRQGRNNRRNNNKRGRNQGRGRRGGRNNNFDDEEDFQPRGRRGGRGQNNQYEDEEEFQPRSRRGYRRQNNNQYKYDQYYEGQAQDEAEYVPHRFT